MFDGQTTVQGQGQVNGYGKGQGQVYGQVYGQVQGMAGDGAMGADAMRPSHRGFGWYA